MLSCLYLIIDLTTKNRDLAIQNRDLRKNFKLVIANHIVFFMVLRYPIPCNVLQFRRYILLV